MSADRRIEQILELARWAPSGDNTQPWRFEKVDDANVVVHGFDTRDHCVYDLDGRPSQLSIGALLETMSIAATGHGLRTAVRLRSGNPDSRPTFDVAFSADSSIAPDPLLPAITVRSVQRRPLRTRSLTVAECEALEGSVGMGYQVVWLEGWAARAKAAMLMFRFARLRLNMPEAYLVHRDIIEWHSKHSHDKVPDQALGIDPVTLRLMRFVMARWERVRFFNRFLAGTLAPRVEMDLLPGLMCGAHFAIIAERRPASVGDYVLAGRSMQRFWLTATSLGLQLQPELTPLIFARYVRDGIRFTGEEDLVESATRLAGRLDALLGQKHAGRAVFLGRVGAGAAARARSLRLPLERLMLGSR